MTEELKIKSYSFSVFRKLYIAIYGIRSKRILKRLIYNTLLAEKLLIDNFKEKYPDKDHDNIVKLSFHVVRKYFKIPLSESEEPFLESNKEIIDIEFTSAKKNKSLEERRARYIEYLKYLFGGSTDYLPEDYPNRSEMMRPEARLLTRSQFESNTRNDIKEYKRERKDLIKTLKLEREKYRIEKAPKIEITSQGTAIVITLFSVLFFITGFIYNQLFLSYFGINLSNFYSIADYLSSSASNTYYALLSVIAALILGLFLYPEYLYGEIPQRPKSKRARRLDDIMFYSLAPLFGVIAIQSYLSKDSHNFYFGLKMFLLFGSLHLVPKIIIFFKNPIRSYFVIWSLLLFFGTITFGAISDINKTLNSELKDLKKYKIEFSDKALFKDESLILLSSTTNYYFFYDKKNSVAKVVPSKEIISVEPLSKKDDKGIYKYLIKPFID